MTGLLLVAILMVGGLAACATRAAPDATATFNPAQRGQIVQVLRDAMKRDPSILREAVIALQADNGRLEAQAQRAAITNHGNSLFGPTDPFVGNPRGSVTVVEFFDPRCPYCRQLTPLLERFVSKVGDVRLVYKDFPILGLASELGSRALLAAQRQGRYQALRQALMARSSTDFTKDSIRIAAQRIGLDWPQLERDMDSAAIERQLAANKELARTLGIDGTPTVVVGQKIVEGPDLPTIVAAVANVRHDRSRDRSKVR